MIYKMAVANLNASTRLTEILNDLPRLTSFDAFLLSTLEPFIQRILPKIPGNDNIFLITEELDALPWKSRLDPNSGYSYSVLGNNQAFGVRFKPLTAALAASRDQRDGHFISIIKNLITQLLKSTNFKLTECILRCPDGRTF